MKKFTVFFAMLLALFTAQAAHAYNIVDLPETMTLSDALEIYSADDITSATVSDISDGQYITLSKDDIKDFYYSAEGITLHRTINPAPFRGTAVNLFTADGVKSFYFNSGVQIGMYGSSNYICYEMQDYDLSKFMYLCSMYQEGEKTNGGEVYPNTDSDFLKLPDDLWAKDSIKEAAARSLLPYQLTDKYPQTISREEFCILIGNFIAVTGGYASLEKYMDNKGISYSRDNFSDCTGRDSSIDMLFALGIINGRGGEYFDPDGAITREEAAKMLTVTAENFRHIDTKYNLNYSDNSHISEWAQFYVKWVSDNGIMSGNDSNEFEPLGFYTVQQAIATVSRLYNVCTDI